MQENRNRESKSQETESRENFQESKMPSNKMGTEPIIPLLITMAMPPMLSMFMQYTYNAVDCMFVSWVSEDALTAVSLAFPITTLILAVSIGLGVGTNTLIAQALGEKNQDKADNVVSHSLILAFLVSVGVTALALLSIKPFYDFFTEDEVIYGLGLDYMYIAAFMVTGNMVHIAIQKVIQATGNMVSPMLFQMAGVVLNFILDPILIFGLWGIPPMGVRGAAAATVAGYMFSTVLAFYVLIFTKQKVKIKVKNFKIDLRIFKDIIIVGFPSLLMNALGAFMVIFANMFLAAYSMTAVAFFGIYFKIQQLIVMTVNGLIQGCMPVMSYNFGAGNRVRLKSTFKCGTFMAVAMMGVGTVFLWVFPELVMQMFRASDEMMAFGTKALRIMSAGYVFAAIGFMTASYFQATRRVGTSLFINILRQLALLVPLMWVLSVNMGMEGIWWAFIWAELITAVICFMAYRKLG